MIAGIPIGKDDFRKLREAGFQYVDKSDLIRAILDRAGVEVILLPRPRRFGKTLNLSMLRCWFEKTGEDLSHLFRDLSIWQAGDAYRAHFQRYPVISLSFKETKLETFDQTLEAIQKKMQAVYDAHRYLRESDRLSDLQRVDFQAILDGTASRAVLDRALLDLSGCLHAHHGERVIILLDEYDEPIHAGYLRGYSERILDFMRSFLGAGLKGNPHLQQAVMTGILRIAKENLFSGLNHIGVYSLLRSEFNAHFGFTETEVAALLERCGRADKLDDARTWYNGYVFGGQIIYNPWSVLCFLDSADADPAPYWLSTSSNDLVKELLEHHAVTVQPVFEQMLEGGSIERIVEENVVLNELRTDQNALWTLLVFSGYLKAEKRSRGPGEQPAHALSIPNREVRLVYSGTFRRWMVARMSGHGGDVDRLTAALLSGDAETFEEQLQVFVTNVLSFHDPGSLDPERVYHAFVTGLLAVLEPDHDVRSNRESGGGRPDVMVRPRRPGAPGAVLELKVARPRRKTLEQALKEGLAQLGEMDYAAELRAAGAAPVHAFVVAFDGKEVRVAAAREARKPVAARRGKVKARSSPPAKKKSPARRR
jgi:Predicted AAA-ATPase/PD-(D/E)XK nuclease superfamily